MGPDALMPDGDAPRPKVPPGVVLREEHERREAEHADRERRQNALRAAELARAAVPGIDLVRESLKIAVFFLRKPLPKPAVPSSHVEVVGLRGEPVRTLGAGAALAERARLAQDNRRMLEVLRWTEKTLRAGGNAADADRVVKHIADHWTPKGT